MQPIDQILRGAPDRADAEARLARLLGAADSAGVALDLSTTDAQDVVRLACQRAPYLAALLCRDPSRLGRVVADPYLRREKPHAVMVAELAARWRELGGDDDRALSAALRHYRADELVRLGARELGLGSPVEVGAELAHLADVCLDAAIDFHRAALEARYGRATYESDSGETCRAELCVIGMGKLGGEELNFASDIDVIYVYSSDAGEVGDLSLHQFFAKLCERVTASIAEVTEDDCVFRVDLRLRPEGSKGPIANSLASLERYYETWGRPWERQAWLKARACAGSAALGDEVLAMLVPFVYPRHTSASVVNDVADLNRRIKSELDRGLVDRGFDVKNGVGGIREVEFFTQALQLIYAGRRPALRCRSTVGALDQLLFAGRITEAEWRTLTGAYRFLRGVEHLLQLDSGRQTQRLPSDPSELEQFAHRAGSADADDFLAVLHGHTDGVARLFATLGDAASGPPPGVSALLGGELETERELRVLAELGFRDPAQAHHQLERSRRRAASPFAPAATGVAARVGPALFAEVCTSPDPDQALRYVADLSSRYGTWSSLWRMMDENPVMRRLVASLFGTSEYLSRHFIDHPELFDMLLSTGRSHPRHRRVELQALAATRLAEVADGDEEAWWNTLAEWKNAQVLRIGLADIAGELDSDEVCHQLSNLAEVCLALAYDRVRAALEERHGVPRDADGNEVGMAVLGLGKLGGRELGYASDLDVLFVYSADGDSDGPRPLANVTYLTRLAQRLMGGLHALHPGGRLYEVDTRLRPSGSAGLLVSTLAAWERYHREGARLWERQALIKLRPVAGDRALGAEVERSALACVYGPPADPAQADPAAVAAAINAMKERIETELSTLGKRDVKVGRGGIIDIEFACQYLQLVHGPSHPSMRSPSTLAALTAAAAAVPEVAETCSLLADAYRFFRTLEHRMRIVHDRSVHRLPDEGPELEKLARRVGLGDGAGLAEIYDRWTRDVRRAYSDLLVPAAR